MHGLSSTLNLAALITALMHGWWIASKLGFSAWFIAVGLQLCPHPLFHPWLVGNGGWALRGVAGLLRERLSGEKHGFTSVKWQGCWGTAALGYEHWLAGRWAQGASRRLGLLIFINERYDVLRLAVVVAFWEDMRLHLW